MGTEVWEEKQGKSNTTSLALVFIMCFNRSSNHHTERIGIFNKIVTDLSQAFRQYHMSQAFRHTYTRVSKCTSLRRQELCERGGAVLGSRPNSPLVDNS